jgi:hypothetical protein
LSKSPDVARSLILTHGATQEDIHDLNPEAFDRLLSLCDFADAFAEEILADSIDIKLSPDNVTCTVFVNTDEIIFEHGRSHVFFERIKAADFLGFSKGKKGMLQMRFGVNNLWVKK